MNEELQRRVAKAFNEWMRRYTEDPDQFEREFQSVRRFLCERAAAEEPSYGECCAAYLTELMASLPA